MTEIKLPVHGIVVTLGPPDAEATADRVGRVVYSGGAITSDLRDNNRRTRFHAAIDARESMILACAVSDVGIEQPGFREAIETTVEATANKLSESS